MKRICHLKHLLFWISILTLTTVSLLIMYHTKFISNIYENNFTRQIIWFTIGYAILSLSKIIPSNKVFKYSKYLYVVGIMLLIMVLMIGKSINGSRAWISIGFISFQPSELMKLFYTCYLSYFITINKTFNLKEEILLIIKIGILFLVPAILIFLEPDTGAIIYLFIITISSLYNSSIRKRYILLLTFFIIIFTFSIAYLYVNSQDLLIKYLGTSMFYRIERLLEFKSGMQIENALTAIGNAPLYSFNLTNVGVYIPESATDFVFALSFNIFGIIGAVIIFVAYLILDLYLLSYIQKISKKEYRYFGYSFLSLLIVNEFINIAMNLGLMPIIGIPLPLISYGGSSTITLFMFLTIIFSNTNGKDNSKSKNNWHKGKDRSMVKNLEVQHYKWVLDELVPLPLPQLMLPLKREIQTDHHY